MSDFITTDKCAECKYGNVDYNDKASQKVYCSYKEKTYIWGQRIPCEYYEKKENDEDGRC